MFDPSISTGTFTITIPDTITGDDRKIAQEAAELVRDGIVLRDLLWQRSSDTSHDDELESIYVHQALENLQRSLENARENEIHTSGWISADVVVESVKGRSTVLQVCHDFSAMTMLDARGDPDAAQLPPGQRATYSTGPYEIGLRISTLQLNKENFEPC